MRKKLMVPAILVILITLLMPAPVLAADATISAGGSYEIDTLYGDSSTITIATTDAVTLTQSDSSTALEDFQIVYSVEGANLEINGINIDNSLYNSRCALSFIDEALIDLTNTLTVVGTNTLISGDDEPGIRVERTTNLTIEGSSTSELNATGGSSSAGIGSGHSINGGYITILSGTIYAYNGEFAAAIGGGFNGNGGNITIAGGTVWAASDSRGAAIGGGLLENGGTINITGGTVYASSTDLGAAIGGGLNGSGGTINLLGGTIYATSSDLPAAIGGGHIGNGGNITIDGSTVIATSGLNGAAIGGGTSGDGGTIDIQSGRVEATSGTYGAGIGGGRDGNGGDVTITGGEIFADGGRYDIGPGDTGMSGTINISSDSAVFLRNNMMPSFTTITHTFFDTEVISGGRAYGYIMPSGWSGTAYAYLLSYNVTYTAGVNGSLSAGSSTMEIVYSGGSPQNEPEVKANTGYMFIGWSDGAIRSFDLSQFIITSNTTLVAEFIQANPKTGNSIILWQNKTLGIYILLLLISIASVALCYRHHHRRLKR